MNADTSTMYRRTDPDTSREAALSAAPRAGSQKAMLLRAFALAGGIGLTDEEAASVTRLDANRACCWWKRCSELRAAGFIADTGRRRPGVAGERRMVCAITESGRMAAEGSK